MILYYLLCSQKLRQKQNRNIHGRIVNEIILLLLYTSFEDFNLLQVLLTRVHLIPSTVFVSVQWNCWYHSFCFSCRRLFLFGFMFGFAISTHLIQITQSCDHFLIASLNDCISGIVLVALYHHGSCRLMKIFPTMRGNLELWWYNFAV